MKKLLPLFAAVLFSANVFAQVSFTADTTSGCAPLTVTFTNTSSLSGNIIWEWDWNDGSPWDIVFDTSHIFTQSGNYNVILYAYDSTWTVLLGQYSMNITVNGAPGIYSTTDTACVNETIGFWVYPDDNVTGYLWDLGDGFTTTDSDPEHAYSDTGSYTIQLSLSTAQCGPDTITQTIVVSNAAVPDARFWTTNPTCPGDAIEFSPENRYAQSYQWYFGDGDSSNNERPTHTYSATGNYLATLTLTNICGNSDTYSDTIRVSTDVYFDNWINFSMSKSSACPGDPIDFEMNFNTPSGYKWYFGDGDSSTADRPTHTYDTLGTYTVSLWVNNGCNHDTTITRTITIGNNLPFSNPYIQANGSPACPNDRIFFMATDAVSYLWDFGDGNTSTEATPAYQYAAVDTYTVTATLTNGCGNDTTVSTQVIISNGLTPSLQDKFGSPADNVCPNDTAIFYSFGGASYLWDFGDGDTTSQTTPVLVDGIWADIARHAYTALGTYTVKLTYTNGCGNSVTDSFTMTVANSQPVNGGFAPFNNPYASCETVNFLAYGGSAYTWYFGDGDSAVTTAGSTSHTYAAAGSYNVSVMITNSCLSTATYSDMVQVQDMNATLDATDVLCNGNSTGQIDLTVTGGVSPYSYNWSSGNTTEDIQNLSAVTYSVTVTDANGCSITKSQGISEPSALSVSTSSTNSTCGNSDGSATAIVSGGSGSYTYSWSNGGNTATISSVAASVYTVTVTDGNGCQQVANASVNDAGAPSLSASSTDVTCNGDNDGAIDLTVSGGTPSYSYSWSNGGNTEDISSLDAGTYNVTVTDANSCIAVTSVSVSEPSVLSLTTVKTNASCNGGNDGSIDLSVSGGNGSYNYSWSNGEITEDITGLASGSYTVTVTDIKGCTANKTVSISQPSAINLTTAKTNVSCNGGSDGTIDLTAGGGTGTLIFAWSNGDTTEDVSGLSVGSYTVTATDANGCTKTKTVSITEPSAISLSASVTDVSCNGLSDGAINLSASGGTGALTYMWSNAATTQDISNLPLGVYMVTVTDASNCTQTLSDTVNEPAPLAQPVITESNDTLSTVSVATTYQWHLNGNPVSGANAQTYIAVVSGTYTLTITDGDGCSATSDTLAVIVNGIHEAISSGTLSIYPNPASTDVFIEATVNGQHYLQIKLTDVTGRVVGEWKEFARTHFRKQVSLSENPAGIYFLQILSGEQSIVRKIVKQE